MYLGQLSVSMMKDILPEQFLMLYDYDFLYHLKVEVLKLRRIAQSGNPIIAHTVLQELAIYLFSEESSFSMEVMLSEMDCNDLDGLDMLGNWAFDLFDDMDIITCLYSQNYLTEDNPYHFDHWTEEQFYM